MNRCKKCRRKTRNKSFCDIHCYGEWLEKNVLGQDNPCWRGAQVCKPCAFCKKDFKSYGYGKKRKYCSMACFGRDRSLTKKGTRPKLGTFVPCKTCGKKFYRQPWQIKRRAAYCSVLCNPSTIKKGQFVGKEHPMWKGGLVKPDDRDRMCHAYKVWRKKVYERDRYKCQVCGSSGRHLTAHHIKKFSSFRNLRFEIMNGITLCWPCHSKCNGREERFEFAFTRIAIKNANEK